MSPHDPVVPPPPAERTEHAESAATGGDHPSHAGRAALLAPFIAWMATPPIDAPTRRWHRLAVEAWLDWCHTDSGRGADRRRRYENEIRQEDPSRLPVARAGLDQFAEYRGIVARTLPVDDR